MAGGLEAEAVAPGGQAGAKGQRQTLEQEMTKFCRWPGEAVFAEPGSRHSFDHRLLVFRFPASWALLGKRFSAGPKGTMLPVVPARAEGRRLAFFCKLPARSGPVRESKDLRFMQGKLSRIGGRLSLL